MRIIRAAECRTIPWKNGGGETTEIAVFPEGASLDDFDWRISMARVECDGPFSIFPNVDRTLTVIDGEGIVLHVEGNAPVTLKPHHPPFAFPADVGTQARLIDGPITDLNVMTRRTRYRHVVERLTVEIPVEILATAAQILVFCLSGRATIGNRNQALRLGSLDTLLADQASGQIRIEPIEPLKVLLIRMENVV